MGAAAWRGARECECARCHCMCLWPQPPYLLDPPCLSLDELHPFRPPAFGAQMTVPLSRGKAETRSLLASGLAGLVPRLLGHVRREDGLAKQQQATDSRDVVLGKVPGNEEGQAGDFLELDELEGNWFVVNETKTERELGSVRSGEVCGDRRKMECEEERDELVTRRGFRNVSRTHERVFGGAGGRGSYASFLPTRPPRSAPCSASPQSPPPRRSRCSAGSRRA